MFKRKSLIVVSCIIIVFAIFASLIRIKSTYMAPVLMYHSVTPEAREENRIQISAGLFSHQMQFLKIHHYNVIPLEALGEMIKKKARIPAKTVALTFDDGYQDNYIYAYPVLKKLGLPATVFIIVNEVGRPMGGRLNWSQIKEMQGSGLITIGSHTLDHPYLPEVKSEAELRRQIFESKKILEEKLGVPVNAFCYPGGRFNAHIRGLVEQAGYKYAFATGLGRRFSNQDVYLVKRVRISESDNLFDFWMKTCGYYNSFRNHNNK